jgi:Skp family chaperone for outer membrane proteins
VVTGSEQGAFENPVLTRIGRCAKYGDFQTAFRFLLILPVPQNAGNEVTNGVFTSAETIPPAKQRSAPAVRKLILTATGFLCLAGGTYFLGTSWGQDKKPPAEDVPHRVGLIDIGYVFEHYEKLKYLNVEITEEMKEAQNKFSAKAKKGADMQEQLKELNEGTPDYTALENRIVKLAAELETEKKMLNAEFQKKRAKMIHQVYLEVYDVVEKFCNHNKLTVIIRFSRADLNSTDPNRVNQLMNQIVVYHRKRDDLTDHVVKYLNDHLPTASGDAKPLTEKRPTTSKKDKSFKPAEGRE